MDDSAVVLCQMRCGATHCVSRTWSVEVV